MSVQGAYLPDYWMHLEAESTAKLDDLDAMLRDTWLECCGHLSAFEIEGVHYNIAPMDDGFGFMEFEDKDMNVPLGRVLRKGLQFGYEYDFGSTTPLKLKVVSEYEAAVPRGMLRIVARNEPPEILCANCGKPATQICTECMWSDEGWFCDECLQEHDCGDEMALPVVNSPRVGECAYTGD